MYEMNFEHVSYIKFQASIQGSLQKKSLKSGPLCSMGLFPEGIWLKVPKRQIISDGYLSQNEVQNMLSSKDYVRE